MLNNVPLQVNKAKRAVVLRHPNAYDVHVFRKLVTRVDTPPGTEGGLPTLGGVAVLKSEDEDKIDWTDLGAGKLLFAEAFAKGQTMSDRGDSIMGIVDEVRAQIECVLPSSDPAFYAPKLQDVVYVFPGSGIALAYEIVSIEGELNIPPYCYTYIMNPRDELTHVPALAGRTPL